MPREYVLRVTGSKAAEIGAAVNQAAEPVSAEDALGSLTEIGARLYLANRSHHPLIFIHAVTAPSALRALLRRLAEPQRRVGVGRVWQYVASMVAAYGDESRIGSHDSRVPLEDIVDQSVETDDAHAIKFVEACVREFRLNRRLLCHCGTPL